MNSNRQKSAAVAAAYKCAVEAAVQRMHMSDVQQRCIIENVSQEICVDAMVDRLTDKCLNYQSKACYCDELAKATVVRDYNSRFGPLDIEDILQHDAFVKTGIVAEMRLILLRLFANPIMDPMYFSGVLVRCYARPVLFLNNLSRWGDAADDTFLMVDIRNFRKGIEGEIIQLHNLLSPKNSAAVARL